MSAACPVNHEEAAGRNVDDGAIGTGDGVDNGSSSTSCNGGISSPNGQTVLTSHHDDSLSEEDGGSVVVSMVASRVSSITIVSVPDPQGRF